MGKIIAFAGKGGTGKTTVCALTVKSLVKAGNGPVLAVDADPNSCLGELLGVNNIKTIGQVREEFANLKMDIPSGMSKESFFHSMLNQLIIENRGWDLLVMGRPEGPGCYCFINNILRKFLEILSSNYSFIVIDNEAGMEHLSRHNTAKADLMIIVAENNVSSIRAAERIKKLTEELGLSVKQMGIVLNKIEGNEKYELSELKLEIKKLNLEIFSEIPFDREILEAEKNKIPFMEINSETPGVTEIKKMVQKYIIQSNK